ncbi:MAG: hypothetical protein KAR05_08775 [Candidatus Omnitrophica bacterium]|nr:hypothetical protein [Candidatus Omnitrophota bacterium]
MEDKEKAEYLIELCKIQMDHFEKTRNLEFKINIALWTLITLVGQFCYINKITLNAPSCILFAVVIIILHIFWMYSIQNSENKDLEFIYQCRLEVLKTIKFTPSAANYGLSPWIVIEVAITVLLIISAISVVLLKTC